MKNIHTDVSGKGCGSTEFVTKKKSADVGVILQVGNGSLKINQLAPYCKM